MNIATRLALVPFVAALTLNTLPAFADSPLCRLEGSYGYHYDGTSFTAAGAVPLTETGELNVDGQGNLSGVATLAFRFPDVGGGGPVWLLLQEVKSGGNAVTADADNPCAGTLDFVATATVIKTSKPSLIPEGTVLYTNSPRSVAFTISGPKGEAVYMISTSPGTIASGTAQRQDKGRRER
jgi:hypothetical protein